MLCTNLEGRKSYNYIGKHGRKCNPNEVKRHKETSQEVFEIAAIGMYTRMIPTRYGLADIFENTGCFTDRCGSDGYSCHQFHFRIDEYVVNRGSERFTFHQVLMHLSERLMIRLPTG
ncbi:hypothetical protein TNCV_1816471 [Trichonephila clavipes]|nr:hypothetical protein TNCV_1816471 [Trichonephila clavipes]